MSDDIVETIVMRGKAAEEIRRLRAEKDKLRKALIETLEVANRSEAGDYQIRAAAAIRESGE